MSLLQNPEKPGFLPWGIVKQSPKVKNMHMDFERGSL
jgi:hypothetical protein